MRHMACHLALMLMPYCPDVVADRVASSLHRLLIRRHVKRTLGCNY